MKAELLKQFTDSIESHKCLLQIFRTILQEDRLDCLSFFCYFNYQSINEMNKVFEKILNEYIILSIANKE